MLGRFAFSSIILRELDTCDTMKVVLSVESVEPYVLLTRAHFHMSCTV